MTEYVFRPLRKGVRSRVWYGRYTLTRGENPRTVALDTPDKLVARKRLRDFIVNAQREAEGLIAPLSERQAAAPPPARVSGSYLHRPAQGGGCRARLARSRFVRGTPASSLP